MLIALAQINPTVGDMAGNLRLHEARLAEARRLGCQLVVFPELSVIGYPPKDLLLKPAAIEQAESVVRTLAAQCTDIGAIIGYPCPADGKQGLTLYNAAALCHEGRIIHRHVKSLLPTYDVFDEHRYFEPGPAVDVALWRGKRLGISVCEDLWNDASLFGRALYHENPIAELAQRGASLFINCSASPFVVGKHDTRLELFRRAAKRHALPLLYCNQVGGNDELIFDGRSCAVDAQGRVVAQGRAFEEELLVVELREDGALAAAASAPKSGAAVATSSLSDLFHALVLGLRDYCRKCGFKSIVLGLSGGIDSALTAALATAAMGKEKVRGVAMPSRFSSEHSLADAREAAARLGIGFDVVPIEGPHKAFEGALSPVFAGLEPGVAEENVQARIRGVILMAVSNKFGSLLVTTGNKSELAVGYCTLYGDMAGGLAVISDVPKTMVWELARWINQNPESPLLREYGRAVIPENSIAKVPSAELRPNQTDQDSLPPYDVLDAIVELYVEQEQSTAKIIEKTGYDAGLVQRVARLIDMNEYKRKQAAPGLKVTSRAFGFGRRMPIAMRFDPTGEGLRSKR
ncbi:MAG: NAD+ synthase [Phycisphaeraceae bacterium]|nr:NAD+ synthase [Phycisphaeraceae bacterium]